MNWRFWERSPTNETQNGSASKEEDVMALYLNREATPEQQMLQTLHSLNLETPESGAAPDDWQEPQAPPDPLAGLTPEQRQAVDERLAYENYQARAALGSVGMDLVQGRPALVDPQRATQWLGVGQQPQYQPQPVQPQGPSPVQEEPDDAPIPDPSYAPVEYRQWHRQNTERVIKSAMDAALAPLVEALQTTRQSTLQMQIGEAMGQVEGAVRQYAPWLGEVINHPDFETYFRDGLSQVDSGKWRNPQDLAALAGTVAAYLRPVADPQYQQSQQPQWAQQPPMRSAPTPTWQDRYANAGYGNPPGYQPQGAPPAQGPPQRNQRGQFIGRGANAAVSRAAAEAAAPSQAARLAPAAAQYEDFILAAAERMGIRPDEAKAIMQDTTGDAAESMRRERLKSLR